MPSLSKLARGLTAFLLIPSAFSKACPPLGPVLPPPKSPSSSDAIREAVQELTAGVESQLTSKLKTSGVSIGVKSIHEDEQLFSYHFTPPNLSGIGTDKIDETTIFRVGSLSKLFPALALLKNPSVDMRDSVLKYIPELRVAKGGVDWEDVTLEALTDHLAGVVTDTAMDLGVFPAPWAELGLPVIPRGTGPSCSGLPGTEPCTTEDLLKAMDSVPAVFPISTSPSYSNTAYALLGMVVEAAYNQTFEEVAQSNIFDVAGMDSSSFNGPVKSFSTKGFVPKGEITWNLTTGVYESAGGMFSNTIDVLAFGEAILTNKLLSPRQTREWLKPATHTASWGMSIGGSWEIMRSDNITSDGRIVDVYTKSGDLGTYHAMMALVPDYDIVIAILLGGPEVAYDAYLSAVVKALVPAIEQAGREETSDQGGFTGTYIDRISNSSMTFSIDKGPGLVIDSFNVRGFDVKHHTTSFSSGALQSGSFPGPADAYVDGRMFPTGIIKNLEQDDKNMTMWRALFETTPEEEKEEAFAGLFPKDRSCLSFFSMDRTAYNFQSLWEFGFIIGDDGSVEGIRNNAFNVTMAKVSSGTPSNTGETAPTSTAHSGAEEAVVQRRGFLAVVVVAVVGQILMSL